MLPNRSQQSARGEGGGCCGSSDNPVGATPSNHQTGEIRGLPYRPGRLLFGEPAAFAGLIVQRGKRLKPRGSARINDLRVR